MAKLEKKDWLLLLLREKPLDRIRLMKALFLIWHRSNRRIDGFYEFVPYMYGPCSFELYRELDSAQQKQFVTQAPHSILKWAPYFLTDRGELVAADASKLVRPEVASLIKSVANEVYTEGFHDLLRKVYAEAPDFATQSVVAQERRL